MKIGSLFDGSGGFPLAAIMCGIAPEWASEVEPFPIAVTRSRFPGMKHLGSVTDVKGDEVEPVDVITFGSPCQDLSVAGKRAGLKHTENGDEETTRSGLFMEAIRIIKEMREATNGAYPRFAVWENVPGAFSSNKGEDFRIVLEEFIKVVEPSAVMPTVPKSGWPYADSYCGDGWSLSYRVLDAQFWGVPQRRRRIYLVADFRGQCAGKVSFEREGLRGHFAESGATWQATAGDAESGVGTADCELIPFSVENHPADSRVNIDDSGKVQTLTSRMGTGGGNVPMVMEPQPVYCLDGDKIGKADRAGGSGLGIRDGDKMYTLTAKDAGTHAVAYWDGGQIAGTLTANNAGGNQRMPDKDNFNCVIALDRAFYNQGQNAQYEPQFYTDGTVPTLVAKGPGAVAVRYIVRRLTPTECARLQGFPDNWAHPDIKETLSDEEYAFWLNARNTHAEINGKATKEYTRDQMLTWYNKLHTDSAEYKLWGNGIALPCALYVMQGVAEVLNESRN